MTSQPSGTFIFMSRSKELGNATLVANHTTWPPKPSRNKSTRESKKNGSGRCDFVASITSTAIGSEDFHA